MSDIDQMDAAQLQIKIAKIMGWKDLAMVMDNLKGVIGKGANARYMNVPNWPNDIAAAWGLVEKAQAKPDECYFGISHTPAIPHKGKPCWHVELGGQFGYGETAPIAICRAFLKWMEARHE